MVFLILGTILGFALDRIYDRRYGHQADLRLTLTEKPGDMDGYHFTFFSVINTGNIFLNLVFMDADCVLPIDANLASVTVDNGGNRSENIKYDPGLTFEGQPLWDPESEKYKVHKFMVEIRGLGVGESVRFIFGTDVPVSLMVIHAYSSGVSRKAEMF